MKKIFSGFVLFAALSLVACNNEKKADKSETKTEEKVDDATKAPATTTSVQAAKAHVCGPDCKDGNHTYAHGEVGHTCTEACGQTHACTEACKDGKHVYAHGEVGHTCTEACM